MGRGNRIVIGHGFWLLMPLGIVSVVLGVGLTQGTGPATGSATASVPPSECPSPPCSTVLPNVQSLSQAEIVHQTVSRQIQSLSEELLLADIKPYRKVVPEPRTELPVQESLADREPAADPVVAAVAADADRAQPPSDPSQERLFALLEELAGIYAAAERDAAAVEEDVGGGGAVLFMTSEDYRMSEGEPTAEELYVRADQVTYEADRRLALLTDAYQLTEEQQALAYPIIARASQAYHPALPIANEELTDAILAASPAESPKPLLPEAYREDPVFLAAAGSAVGPLEDRTRPLLDPDQQAAMDDEQADRFDWWNEILSRISASIDAEEAAALALQEFELAGLSQPDAGPETTLDDTDTDDKPAAHQGGNLFGRLHTGH